MLLRSAKKGIQRKEEDKCASLCRYSNGDLEGMSKNANPITHFI